MWLFCLMFHCHLCCPKISKGLSLLTTYMLCPPKMHKCTARNKEALTSSPLLSLSSSLVTLNNRKKHFCLGWVLMTQRVNLNTMKISQSKFLTEGVFWQIRPIHNIPNSYKNTIKSWKNSNNMSLSSWTAFKLSHKQKKGMKIISNHQNRKEFPLTQIIVRMILHYCKNTKPWWVQVKNGI